MGLASGNRAAGTLCKLRTAKAALKVNIMPISVAETTYIVLTVVRKNMAGSIAPRFR